MKKILLTLVVFASVGLVAKLNAQCTVSNVAVHLNSTSVVGSNCVLNIDVSFDLQHNGGNKFIFIHLWRASQYPAQTTTFGSSLNTAPTATQLAATVANIGIDNHVNPPTYLTTYAADNTVTLQVPTGLSSTGGSNLTPDHFVLSGLNLSIPGGCNQAVEIKGDVWSSQAQSGNSVSCLSGTIDFFANDPTISGFKTCANPRTLNLGIQTISATNISISYKLFKDDGDLVFEPGTDDSQVGSAGPFNISASSSYSNTAVSYTGNNAPGEHSDIWVEVTNITAGGTKVYKLFANGACAPLPIGLKSFSALRNHSSVNVAWVTSYEQNAKGFELQRQIGGGSWQTITFVPTKAVDGYSKTELSYNYTDMNAARAISNYRIAMIDLDGKTKYSEIRSVRGEGQIGKIIVYPNPSIDGKVKVVFDDASGMRDVSLMDVNGRIVKQWKDVSNNNLQIDNLTAGFYSLRVVIRETGEQSIEKIVVNKR
jgi:hypothetical protein